MTPITTPKQFTFKIPGTRFPVRALRDAQGFWFVGTDIGKALHISEATVKIHIRSRVDANDKALKVLHTVGGPQRFRFLSPAGFAEVVSRCMSAEARSAEAWLKKRGWIDDDKLSDGSAA